MWIALLVALLSSAAFGQECGCPDVNQYDLCLCAPQRVELGCVPIDNNPVDHCCIACCNSGTWQCDVTCPGDCNGDDTVSVAEVTRAVGIALGMRRVASCRYADTNRDGRVVVSELLRTVGSALTGCGRRH